MFLRVWRKWAEGQGTPTCRRDGAGNAWEELEVSQSWGKSHGGEGPGGQIPRNPGLSCFTAPRAVSLLRRHHRCLQRPCKKLFRRLSTELLHYLKVRFVQTGRHGIFSRNSAFFKRGLSPSTEHSSQCVLNWHTGEIHGNSWDPDQGSEVCSTPPSLDHQLLTFSPKVSAVSCLGSQQHHQRLLAFLSQFWMLQRAHPTDRRWTFCVHHPGPCRLYSTPSWWHKEAPKPWQLLLLFLSPHKCSLQHISGATFSLLQERTGRAEENQEVMRG